MLDMEVIRARVVTALNDYSPLVEEKRMFKGSCFMVEGKMCLCINKEEMLFRIGLERATIELEQGTCRQMINKGRVMKAFIFVEYEVITSMKLLDHWIKLCLKFHAKNKAVPLKKTDNNNSKNKKS